MPDLLDRLKTALADRYAIEREIGAGGMATVYLAEDLKHHRKVAVKVLRPELAAVLGGDRFLREIEIAAKLTHPHILPLHDSGEADGFLYYVMPYVDGESLRTRLEREGQLPIDDALRITRQVAAALEYAHREEIIHRDIKPENILLHRGEVMVADFGIALAVRAAGGVRLTETGLSIGTPQYMSPEQASGDRHIDGRTDIYSLGCVLYETLVGEAPYTGPTSQAIIAKVLTEPPPSIRNVRDTVSPALEQVVLKSLAKLAADRFGTVQEFAEALGDPQAAAVRLMVPALAEGRRPFWRAPLPWAIAGAVAVTVGVLVTNRADSPPTGSLGITQFAVRLPPTQELSGVVPSLALTRDGTRLVILLEGGGILVRDMAEPDAEPISDAGLAETNSWNLFLSPDGNWVAFHDEPEQQLRRVSIDGGSPIPITSGISALMGGTWGPQNTIVYSPGLSSGLWRVSVDGGTPEQLTVPDLAAGEFGHWWPQILPGGTKVLFSNYRTPIDSASIEVLDLETRARTVLLSGGQFARYAPTGHIVYVRYETMWAVPFDLDRLQLTGPRESVLEGVAYSAINAHGGFAISENGTLAYIKASVWDVERRLVWVDRDGTEQPVMDEWGRYDHPAISRDGGRLAFVLARQGKPDLWVSDLARGRNPIRVTRHEGAVWRPLWTRDGTRIIYAVEQPQFDLFWRDWEARTPEELLLTSDYDKVPSSISPDGRELAFTVSDRGWSIWLVPLEGEHEPRVFRATEHIERNVAFSPDGRWIAYESDESGRFEIWLQSYPDTGRGRRQISTDGGRTPLWGRDGELFYHRDNQMMAVQIDLASGLPGTPTVLFEGPYKYMSGLVRNYDITPDGRRFLMVKPRPGAVRREVMVVLNWFEELKARVGN